MASKELTTSVHELTTEDGTKILLQGDPSASDEWDALMEAPYAIGNRNRAELIEALAALAQTPKDAEKLRKANLGGRTINETVNWYIEAVTGFPLERPAPSTTGSKKTGGT